MKECLKDGFIRLGSFVLCLAAVVGALGVLWGFFSIVRVEGKGENNGTEQRISEKIRLGLYLFSDSISFDGEGLRRGELCDAFSHVYKDDPYLFFVSDSMSYTCDADGNVIAMSPAYLMTGSEALLAFFYCEARLSDICAIAEDIEDDREKAAFLHDYICENFEYDKELENDDIYSFLLEKKGTCRAYTMLYTALLRKCGIDATYAVREGDETAGHMWNEVVIDGVSYSVDVTWDDALSEENISREYFMTGKK